jgi:hypothetical protein
VRGPSPSAAEIYAAAQAAIARHQPSAFTSVIGGSTSLGQRSRSPVRQRPRVVIPIAKIAANKRSPVDSKSS